MLFNNHTNLPTPFCLSSKHIYKIRCKLNEANSIYMQMNSSLLPPLYLIYVENPVTLEWSYFEI